MAFNNELAALRSVVLDIETIGSPEAADLLDPIKPPANYKDPEKIAAYCAEELTKQVKRAGLEPDLCEVVAVGWRQSEEDLTVIGTRAEWDEPDLLRMAWEAVERRTILGFNVLSFDLPVLIRRSQLLEVDYPAVNLDRYRTPHIDLLERLSFTGKLTFRSLAFYCRRFGIPCADPTTGAQIAEMVAAEHWEGVRAHCQADVEKTAALAMRLGWLRGVAAVV